MFERWTERHPWVPYVVPFAVFMAWLVIGPKLPVPPRAEAILRVTALVAVIAVVARPVLSFRLTQPLGTIGVGVLVFVLWILPDLLIPGYRASALFQNSLTGKVASSLSVEVRTDWVVLGLRFVRAAMIVPVVEELFWRGWLPRWLERMGSFWTVPLGEFSRYAFWATAILFALEHGPFWDVGLLAGLVYNWWMQRTKSLGDLIWCHAITNACLSVWVVGMGDWRYW
jgi:CAAX prenyl protease-like protein